MATMIQEEHSTPTMSHEKHPGKAVTYGDVFPALAGGVGSIGAEPITTEDASLMQAAEAMSFGKTQKGGAASMMQSAAAKNVQDGLVERNAHSMVAEAGLSVTETSVPGAVMDIEYVAGQPVAGSAHPTPTIPAIAALDAVTIGEALEAAAVGAGDRPLDENDARAILSAEARATGMAMPQKGGIGASAQSAAQFNTHADGSGKTTLADVLMDATADLPTDKVVTYEDALKVLQAELKGRDLKNLQPGGVGASILAAANLNEQSGLTLPLAKGDGEFFNTEDGEKKQDDSYQPLDSATDNKQQDVEDTPLDSHATDPSEDTFPVVSKDSEKLTSHGSAELPVTKEQPPAAKQTSDDIEDTTPLREDKEKLPSHGSEKLPVPKHTEHED